MPDKMKPVKAFPIAAQIAHAGAPYPSQIVKLTMQGFLAEMTSSQLKTGDKFDCTFQLPIGGEALTEACVVIKHYTHWIENQGTKVAGYLIEGHFRPLSDKGGAQVSQFLRAVNAGAKAGDRE